MRKSCERLDLADEASRHSWPQLHHGEADSSPARRAHVQPYSSIGANWESCNCVASAGFRPISVSMYALSQSCSERRTQTIRTGPVFFGP
jgi:hypothetical protein